MRLALRLLPVLLAGCGGCKDGGESAPDPLLSVAESARYTIDGLSCPAQVVLTDGAVPHLYAHDRTDLAIAQGFVVANDRYFVLDLSRRLGLGRVSELLGQDALQTDMESRGTAMSFVADRLCDNLTPEQADLLGGFATGVNSYILQVQAGDLPVPDELALAGPLLGVEATSLMEPFELRDMCGIAAVLTYELGFETADVGRAYAATQLDGLFDGAALGDARQAGLLPDVWNRMASVQEWPSAPDFQGGDSSRRRAAGAGRSDRRPARARVPAQSFERLLGHLDRIEARQHHDHDMGWGSNAWAMTSAASSDGTTLLAGDGHLSLSVPSLFYQMGLDTRHLGGGDTHQLGLVIPGMPILAVGTNGKVAWGQTQLMGDITDWYEEELQLGADGLPAATLSGGSWSPVASWDETYTVADVPLLGSDGRSETWTIYTTGDGRWLADIEGRSISSDEIDGLGDGEGVVNLQGDLVSPGDVDGDGVVTAISFDYTGLDDGNIIGALDAVGHADDVEGVRQATRRLVAYSQNIVAADCEGSVLYTSYQAVPCRGYLPQDSDGAWIDGADPTLLIDGDAYGGFTIPVVDGVVDETSSDALSCVIPFEDVPQSVDPTVGYVITANNDPAGIAFDEDLNNDGWYIGGPWMDGWRAVRISERLDQAMAEGTATAAGMADIQADDKSPFGCWYTPDLLAAIDRARALDAPDADSADGRLQAAYLADSERIDAAYDRLSAWESNGCPAASGVETFYSSPTADDVADSVATSIFNAWFGPFVNAVFDDEGFPDVWRPTGKDARIRVLEPMLRGRGADNPRNLGSWSATTLESAYFDVLGTEPVESSDELMVEELRQGLDYLESAATGEGSGGYGTAEMDEWLWGLRHVVEFKSLLADFLDGDEYSFITDSFGITPAVLPLATGMASDDPRADLTGFPRPGDNNGVDAANNGFSGTDHHYGSGPSFRMVVALSPDGTVSGADILPGGQSALLESPHFADQAALWLGNDALPLLFAVDDVVAGAIGRIALEPADGATCD